jgi:hypothetical protein
MARRRDRDETWSHLAIIGALTAMVVVMAVTAFTLHKSSPLIAGRPQITTYQPATTREADVVPLRGLSGSERSIEGSPEPRERERSFVPVAPAAPRRSPGSP